MLFSIGNVIQNNLTALQNIQASTYYINAANIMIATGQAWDNTLVLLTIPGQP